MIKTTRHMLVAFVTLVVLAGCSSGIIDTDVPNLESGGVSTVERDNSKPETPTETQPAAQRQGVVVVDGVSYGMDRVTACEPYEQDLIERELELQGTGKHGDTRTQIDVVIQTISGTPMNDVSWAGPEGIFGDPVDLDLTVDEVAARVSGSATLNDAMTQEETLFIEFDLDIPAETISCR